MPALLPSTLLTTPVIFAAVLLLLAASARDIAARLIPDALPLGLLACGLVLRLHDGTLLMAGIAALGVFSAATLAWFFRLMGGGDVKLLGATAMVVPPALVPSQLLLISLAGGLLALLVLALRAVLPRAIAPVRPASLIRRLLRAEHWRIRRGAPLPYGVAIAAGTTFLLIQG